MKDKTMKQEEVMKDTEAATSPNNTVVEKEWVSPTLAVNNFDVGERYRPLQVIGAGAYGTVCCALDLHTSQLVAIKKIPSVFNDLKEAKRAVREVRLLAHFRGHPNILQILDLFYGRSEDADSFRDLYIVTEFLKEGDATSYTSNKEKQESLKDDKVLASLIYSLCKGLTTLHAAGVLHRDLRLKNLLVNENKLKICDLGAGRGQQNAMKRSPSEIRMSLLSYVSSLYYTAPEALLPNTDYTSAVDIWAAGCVFAELVLGTTLFKGEKAVQSNVDQFKMIADIVGFDLDEQAICDLNTHERFRKFLRELPHNSSHLEEKFVSSSLSQQGFDLLQRMLTMDPKKRITAAQALEHPWFNDLKENSEEQIPGLFNGDDIDAAESKEEIRELLQQELCGFASRSV